MSQRSRREFLRDVGRGVVAASVGSGLAAELGFSTAFAERGPERLTFGPLEPLVSLMQETPAERLVPLVVDRLRQGTALRQIVAAAALANARTFGGEDYVGFHTMMAIAPAFHMAGELPEARRALPVLKVLFRNATRIQEFGGPPREVLHAEGLPRAPLFEQSGDALRNAIRRLDARAAERAFAATAGSAQDSLNDVLYAVQDGAEVHRVVLPYRAWDLLDIVGYDHSHTLLRQSVHYCVRAENSPYWREQSGIRTLVPRLLDQYRLPGRETGTRTADDRWVDETSQTIFSSTRERAAETAAAALAEGMAPAAVSEAISLAANQLILRDNGRLRDEAPNKPAGSVHGDSIGLHACDSANAWRNLARVANPRNRAVCLILGAWQVAQDRSSRGGSFLEWQPYPRAEAREQVRSLEVDRLLPALEDAIRNRDQARAAAATARYGESGREVRPLWDMLLRYAVSEDGALHAEKFYRTATEEFASTRAAFRWRHLIALARVTASAHGYPAPGHTEACRLLGV
jgi:hypothetical protein